MNFSHPKPIPTKLKKQSGFQSLVEKISAVIGIIEGMFAMGSGKSIEKKLTAKQRDGLVRWIIYLLAWFMLAGLFQTGVLIKQLFNFIF